MDNNNNNNNNNERDNNTVLDTSRIISQKQPYRNELLTLENGNATQANNPKRNTITKTKKVNLENLKRIMNSEKTTEWRIVKTETNKINQLLPVM